MKNPKILYILISMFCIFAVIAGVYAQFIDVNHGGLDIASEVEQSANNISNNNNNNTLETDTQTEIRARL